MKQLYTIASMVAALGAISHAQVTLPFTVTPVGVTSGSTMPGSPSDFIFFNASNYPYLSDGYPSKYPDNNVDNGTVYSQLSSFSISGGVQGSDGNGNYATITTPGGTSLQTGDVQANGGIAFALEPGVGTNSDQGTEDTNLNANFNYNDFLVYVMVSNTGGTFADTEVALDPRTFNPSANLPFGTTAVPIVETTASNSAQFVEFHVTGLGDAITAGYKPDLVLSANLNPATGGSGIGYIGGVSFVSIAAPEPSTLALAAIGIGAMVFLARRKSLRA